MRSDLDSFSRGLRNSFAAGSISVFARRARSSSVIIGSLSSQARRERRARPSRVCDWAKALAHHTPKYQCRPTLVANQSVVARMTVSMQLRSVIYELDLVLRRNSGAARANTPRSSQEHRVAVAFLSLPTSVR